MMTNDDIARAYRTTQAALDSLDFVIVCEDIDLWVGRARNSLEQALRFLELAQTFVFEDIGVAMPDIR